MIGKNKVILITGVTGFVGSNLVRKLVEKGFTNINILIRKTSNLWRINDIKDKLQISYVSILNIEELNSYINLLKPNIIFHLAAAGANIGRDERGIVDIFEQNTIGTINLINACKKVGFDYFINTGSSSEYGEKNKAMNEDDILEPNNEYGLSKASASMYASFIGKKYNLPIYTFRLFAVYGSFEDKKRLIPTLILNYINGLSPNLSTPNSIRDYIFIDDVINYYLNIDKLSGDFGGIYNVGNGIQYSIGEIVERIKKISKSPIEPTYGTESIKQNEPKLWICDKNKTNNTFGLIPTGIDEGLIKTYKWFNDNLDFYK